MQESDAGKYTAMERIQAVQRLNRYWRPHLSTHERDLVSYLIDNTVFWGRDEFTYTIDQMVDGGRWGLPPCGIARATLCRTLASLRERGLIETRTNGRYSHLTINLSWGPQMNLKVPKRLRQSESGSGVTRSRRTDFYESDDPTFVPNSDNSELSDGDFRSLRAIKKKSQIETLEKGRNRKEGIETQTIAAGFARDGGEGAGKPEGRQTRLDEDGKVIPPAPRTLWADAWKLAYPKVPCPPWPRKGKGSGKEAGKEFGMARTVVSRCAQMGLNEADFITWLVSHWAAIRSAQFGWMRNNPPPAYPEISFTLKFLDKFFDAYAERETQDRLALESGDAVEMERMLAAGLTRDAALMKLGEQRALSKARAELEKREAAISLGAKVNTRAAQREAQEAAERERRLKRREELDAPTLKPGALSDPGFEATEFELPDTKWEDMP